MKKIIKILLVVLTLSVGIGALTACEEWFNPEKEILVVAREAGSGTRDAFDGMIKNANGDSLAKKADGTNQPSSIFVSSLNLQEGTAGVRTKVASLENTIGYISLGSVDSSVKVLSVGGVVPSSETVLDGSYALSRPFVIMTKKDQQLTAATQDFIRYLNSSTAQSIVGSDYVRQDEGKTGAYTAPAGSLSGTVLLRGSTSVEPLMNDLIGDYRAKGGANVANVNFDLDAQGSSPGVSAAKADTAGNVIGMSSSTLKESDAVVLDQFNIALDAVAIIVHKNNKVNNLTIEQIFDIYTGAVKKFSAIK
jgi:phosphate transport system substrate-binding protein